MTTSSIKPRARQRSRHGGFTLVEVMITAALSTIVLAALLTAFMMIVRSGTVLYNYVGMEEEARRGLERFGVDTRMASNVAMAGGTAWKTDVTLTVPHVSDSDSNTVRYWWDGDSSSATYQCFRRQEKDKNGVVVSTTTLIHDVTKFEFTRWQAGGTPGTQATSAGQTDQLQIQLVLNVQRSQAGVKTTAIVATTNLVVSARYILRNKPKV